MNISIILTSVLVVAGSGLLIGLLLGLAGKKFAVETDEREMLVREALPGNNCGGCGYPGCDGAAAAIVSGEAPVTVCPVGGSAVAKEIGDIMGAEVAETTRMRAYVHCSGSCDNTRSDYVYTGVEDCNMMPFLPGGGEKRCSYGCTGYGSCVKACGFDAIQIVNGVAVVDQENCKACGVCIKTCPKKLIELIPYEGAGSKISCASKDKGKAVLDACDIGCIACKKCEKNCPANAIKVEDNVARIDYSLCTDCGNCKEVCPRGCIN